MTMRTAAAADPPHAFAPAQRERWMLDPAIDFINHGCFGARLREVHDAHRQWRERFEARPVEFLERRRDELIGHAKQIVGRFLGMTPGNFGFTTNATDSVNAVVRSLQFEPGDQIVTTSHVYPAVRQSLRYLAGRADATVVEIDVPLPTTADDVVTRVTNGLTDATRLLVVDHVTSPTAIRFPVERLVSACRERGIDVLVDGAHAPGMLPLNVEKLDAAYYAGNLHKWVCAPPGAAFLWVRPDRQAPIHPTVISHSFGEGLSAELAWQGTRDISAWLAAADSIEQMDGLDGAGSWNRIREHNHALATWVQAMLTAAWGVPACTPADGSMLGSMTAVPLPDAIRQRGGDLDAFQLKLYEAESFEVPIFEWEERWLIRASCQVYNTAAQYERLAACINRMC